MANQIQNEQAGRYQPYPEYKDSSLEWLGKIPSHWDINKLKFVVNINMGQSPDSNQYSLDKLGIPFLQGNAEFGIKHPTPKLYCSYLKKIAEKGSILFSVRAPVGAQNIADQKYGIGRGLCSFTVNEKLLKSFLWWLLVDCKEQLLSKATGSTFEAVTVEQISNILFTYPPLQEQTQIAQFLDYETAKIDLLIEKQQKLIELLKEKRQAVISHAVTKGFDPDVEMKDSGVEWLGEVPAHWEVLKGGYIGKLFGSENVDEKDIVDNGSILFLKVSNLSLNKLTLGSKNFFVTHNKEAYINPKKDFIVFPKRGAAISTNKVNIISQYSILDPNLMGWEIYKEKANIIYIAYVLKSRGLYDIADVSTVPQINNKHIEPQLFPVPPLSEQTQIVEYIDIQTSKIDLLIEKAEAQITLMQERRTALISAAVTGKIDLRHWQMPEESDHQGGDNE